MVQRVSSASVTAQGQPCATIGRGLLTYLGVDRSDTRSDAVQAAQRVGRLRIFPDVAGRMNLDVFQAGGQVLVVSAFTLMADARRGRRPSFEAAQKGAQALELYEAFCESLAESGIRVQRGVFGAEMAVQCVNAGPVCILIDSKKTF